MEKHKRTNKDDKPPFLRTWKNWYLLLMILLLLQIIVYAVLTRIYT